MIMARCRSTAGLFRLFCFLAAWPAVVVVLAGAGRAAVLTGETVWQGEVVMAEDCLVAPGAVLTIRAGTVIRVQEAESSKTDPEFWSPATELTVRGRLRIEGTADRPVRFLPAAAASRPGTAFPWAGIIVDSGSLTGGHLEVSGALAALEVKAGEADLARVSLAGNRYGVVASTALARVRLRGGRITGNDYGVLLLDGGVVEAAAVSVAGNGKRDWLPLTRSRRPDLPPAWTLPAGVRLTRSYGNEAIVGTVVWRGRVVVDGVVRVGPDARLVVLPGTVVEFVFRDSNGDAIGESGLMIQGQLVAKGTPERPVFFRAQGAEQRPGLWDAINILGSDQRQNLIEYAQIESAYRGVHFHFANVLVNHVQFRGNYRGSQFQESLVTVRDSLYAGNKSALRARDSQVRFVSNRVCANGSGANFYRMDVEVRANRFEGNDGDGLRIREGAARVRANLLAGNRYGLSVSRAVFGRFAGNVLTANIETGLAVRDCDRIVIEDNAVTANGVTGISLRSARVVVQGNLVAGNGERGIGILSFFGRITDNTIAANGEYGIGLDGPGDVDAARNWWGGDDPGRVIYDAADEPGLGRVRFEPLRDTPLPFAWPLRLVRWPVVWAGVVAVPQPVAVVPGGQLTVLPGSEVRFGPGSGLTVAGRIVARGTPERRIRFTALRGRQAKSWGEISLEYAAGSVVSHCDFQYATWGLHVHYTPMTVSWCRFLDSDGGMRFRSGPYEIRDNLFARNRIGLRAYRATAAVRANVFRDNEIGIFVREKGGGLSISGNNLYNNERYNLRVGDFDVEDVTAPGNWWGEGGPGATIFDGRLEPGLGVVRYQPAAARPLALPVESVFPAQSSAAGGGSR